MAPRLKFYGWGHEGEGLSEDERAFVFRFVAEKLGAEARPALRRRSLTSRSGPRASRRPPLSLPC